jgi:16S rRNA (cytidine1402-2'-O)-methyltransferase
MVIDTIQFSEIDKHKGPDVKQLKVWLNAGIDVGVMSEAGCPGVADPGAELVAATHNMGAEVIPLTGPSSILLALMASGLNGQSFAFAGYLPLKEPARSKKIQMVEQRSQNEQQTQIFIETPYRNSALLSELLKVCKNNTRLCIAQNITAKNAVIKTKTIAEWKKEIPRLEKAPAVFLILA